MRRGQRTALSAIVPILLFVACGRIGFEQLPIALDDEAVTDDCPPGSEPCDGSGGGGGTAPEDAGTTGDDSGSDASDEADAATEPDASDEIDAAAEPDASDEPDASTEPDAQIETDAGEDGTIEPPLPTCSEQGGVACEWLPVSRGGSARCGVGLDEPQRDPPPQGRDQDGA